MQPKARAMRDTLRASGWTEDRWGNFTTQRPDGVALRVKFQDLSVRLERQIVDPNGDKTWVKIDTVYDADIEMVPGNPFGWKFRTRRYAFGLNGVPVQILPVRMLPLAAGEAP